MNSAMILRSPTLAGGGGVRVRLYSVPAPTQFARGGLAKAAEMTRAAGRGDDEVLLHITPEEFEALKAQWGEPTINPRTGLPEYGFLSKAWKKVKKTFKKIAPYVGLVTSVFFPALAPAIGAKLGMTGLAAQAMGNAVIHGVAGGATGGAKGALAGAVTGGLGSYAGKIGEYAGLKGNAARIAGSAALGGVGSKIQGGDFASGALQGGLSAYMQPTLSRMGETVRDSPLGQRLGMSPVLREVEVTARPMGSDAAATASASGTEGSSSTSPASSGTKTGGGDLVDLASKYLPVAVLASSLGGSGKAQESGEPPPLPPEFTRPLPQVPFNRSQITAPTDWYTYGMRPEQSFFQENAIPEFDPNQEQEQKQAADGGSIYRRGGALSRASRLVSGPGTGRSDSIPAQLSDGEYVLTAEDVALIGDGSSKAGAQKLDEWRRELRKHKGRALARGKISPNAKSPMAYLRSAK